MTQKLKTYFPNIRQREELLEQIHGNAALEQIFNGWNPEQQNLFLNCCTGVRGVRMLYDSFFKIIMDPDAVPERMEELLFLLLGQNVRILKVLPQESRIAAEDSLLILDIVVELADGSIANVEVQKIGYAFPGQRAACYSSDLLLRQYERVKSERKNSSATGISVPSTPLFFSRKVPGNSGPFRTGISTGAGRFLIPAWKWTCFRNTSLFPLTTSGVSRKIKI